MSITLSGDGSITGLTATGIDAVQNLPTGSVLQVVNAIQSSAVSTTSATFVDTGLSASITPKFSTSKILVIVTQVIYSGGTSGVVSATQLLRGSTPIVVEGYCFYVGDNFYRSAFNYLDSPSTTSATTYKTQFRKLTGGGSNITYCYGDGAGQTNCCITLMEIAA
jgi:hypothetical protein